MKVCKKIIVITMLCTFIVCLINTYSYGYENKKMYPKEYIEAENNIPTELSGYTAFTTYVNATNGKCNVSIKDYNLETMMQELSTSSIVKKSTNANLYNYIKSIGKDTPVIYLGIRINKISDYEKIELYNGTNLLDNLDFSYCKKQSDGSYVLFLEMLFNNYDVEESWSKGTGWDLLNKELEVKCYEKINDANPKESMYFSIIPASYAGAIPFNDVKESNWYYKSVEYCYKNNIFQGRTDALFAPNDNLTRANLVTVLWRMEGSQEVDGIAFKDVSKTAYYYEAIKWAIFNKIVNGYDDGTFRPNNNITREQLATILMNYAKYKKKNTNERAELSSFIDNKGISSYAQESISWAVAKKIISGKSNGTRVDPSGTATRAESAAMITNYCTNIGR